MNGYYPPSTDLSFVKPTLQEEQALFEKMRAGDDAARETIIRHHMLFVAMEARRLNRGQLPDEDVVSAANMALMEAVSNGKFDHTRGNRFTSYLRPFVRGAISELWKHEFNRPLPVEDPEACGEPEERVTMPPMEENDHQNFLRKALKNGCDKLDERESQLIALVYEHGLTLAAAGRRMKISRQWASEIHKVAIGKLRSSMRAQGANE